MIDIETLSTRHDAAILSIGAVFFDTETLELGETFSANIEMNSGEHYGHIDPETVNWWLKQSEVARNNAISGNELLNDALRRFKEWILYRTDRDRVQVWAKSPSFDLIILSNAFKRVNSKAPWKYYNERDVRTCIEVGKNQLNRYDGNLKPSKYQHTALADAQFQAAMVLTVYDKRKEIQCT